MGQPNEQRWVYYCWGQPTSCQPRGQPQRWRRRPKPKATGWTPVLSLPFLGVRCYVARPDPKGGIVSNGDAETKQSRIHLECVRRVALMSRSKTSKLSLGV